MNTPDHIERHTPIVDNTRDDDGEYQIARQRDIDDQHAITLTPAQVQRAKDVEALLAMTYKDISRDTLEWLLKQAWDDGHVCGRSSV